MPELLAHLNERQLAAVTLPAQHALILAGAGSGKTRVITTRIAWLIQTGQCSPEAILAVTFTNKAAREMLTRVTSVMPLNPRGMWVGTFHGLCNRLLRAHYRDAALPQTFQILDSTDQLAAIKRVLKALSVDDEKYAPRGVQHFINGCKEEGVRASEVPVTDAFNRRMVEIYAAYDAQCQREGVVDFPELLLRAYELLARHEPLRAHYQARFKYILIDEFQDTNVLQYRWIKLLTGPQSAVFAVGDDDQSIYAFRGANVGNMKAFEREFQVRNLIKLEQNYRSHGHILDCANHLIRLNPDRLGKELWTEAGAGEPVRVHEALSDGQEAQWLIEEARALIAAGSLRSDIAILYRSNAQSRVLEHALFSAGIPYRVYGGLRFFERAEVKHALAYLRLMANPDDDTALLRVINFPARGIGARSLEHLQDIARATQQSLYRAIAHMPSGAMASKLAGFVAFIERLRGETLDWPLSELIKHVIERSGLFEHYQTEREGQERIDNLRELVNAVAAYMAEQGLAQDAPATTAAGPAPGLALPLPVEADWLRSEATSQNSALAGFLAHASLESGDNQAGVGADALQLMTVHAAKGLEFESVFITGLEEGLFPHENALQDHAGLQEERRLMYVALTRARHRLYLSFSQTRMLHGQTRYNLRSRFFDELPEGALKWLTPRTGLQRSGSAWSEQGSGWGGGRAAGGYGGAAPRADVAASGLGRSDVALAGRFERGLPWRMGQSVAHAKFGEGVILAIEGSGSDARVQVNFGPQGVKWLALSMAKLQAIPS